MWNCGTLKFIVLLYRQIIIIVPLGGGFVISALKGPQRQQHRIPIKFRFNEDWLVVKNIFVRHVNMCIQNKTSGKGSNA